MRDDSKKPHLMQIFKTDHVEMKYREIGTQDAGKPTFIWAHGWGQDHKAMTPLAESLAALGRHIIIDTPGFGESPIPFERVEDSWDSLEYAHFMAAFIKDISPNKPIIWIGHSFGCRIGTQLGAHYPDLIDKMIFIAGAGLKRKRTLIQTMVLKGKIYIFKMGKPLKKLLNGKQFGSADYKKAGPMRGTLVKLVNESLEQEAAKITCPLLLLYGEKDTETPPEIGDRYHKIVSTSEILHLSGQDHYTVLEEGRHQVAACIKQFVTKANKK